MEFWTIVFLTIISLTIVGIIGWFILLYKKNKLLTKSTSKEIKYGLFSFINLIILSMITTSIVVGLQMSYVNSKNTLETINNDYNMTHTEMQKTGIKLNRQRVMNFPLYSVNSAAADSDNINPGHDNGVTWTTPELVGGEIETFPEWVKDLTAGTQAGSSEQLNILQNNLILNIDGLYDVDANTNLNLGIWSDDNVFGMYIYILNMLNKYEHRYSGHEIGFNFEFSLEVDWYKNKDDSYPSGTIKLVKKSDKDSTLNKPANTLNRNSKDYYVNDVMYQNLSEEVIRDDKDIYLQDNQAIVSTTFSRKNNIENGDKIYFQDSILGSRQELTMAGNGTMSSDLIVQANPSQPPEDPKTYSFAFVNDEFFNNILFTKLYNSLPNDWQTKPEINLREYLVNTGLVIYERIGYASVYERIDAGIVNYEDAFFSTESHDKRLKKLSGTEVYGSTKLIVETYGSSRYRASGKFTNEKWEESITGVTNQPWGYYDGQGTASIFYQGINEGQNNNWEVLRYSEQYKSVNMQKVYSGPLTIIFLVTNILIIFMFTKRRIVENLPNIATLKALGHRTSKITASYTMYPILITSIGGFLGVLNALWLQKLFMSFLLSSMTLPLSATYITIGTIFWNLILPILITTILITFVMYVILKNNAFSAMQGESQGKPNLLVRGWSKVSPSNFMVNYRVKNTLRAFGKSSFIITSILLSSTLLLLGSTFNDWQNQASEMTVESWMGDAEAIQLTLNKDRYGHKFETTQQADQKIEEGTYQPYTFTKTPGTSTEQAITIIADALIGFSSGKNELNIWKDEVGSYLVEESMEGKYITSGLDLSAIWTGDIFVKEQFEAAIQQIGNGFSLMSKATDIEAAKEEIGNKLTKAVTSGQISGLTNKFFEILSSWSKGEAHISISVRPPGTLIPGIEPSLELTQGSHDILDGFANLFGSMILLDLEDGYMPALLHTMAIKLTAKEPTPDDGKLDIGTIDLDEDLEITYTDPFGNKQTKEFNISFNDVHSKLLTTFFVEIFYSVLKNPDIFKAIIDKNASELPLDTEYETMKLLPGIKTFEEGNSFPLKISAENITTNMAAGTTLNLIYDDKSINNISVNLFEEEKGLKEKTDEYVEENIKDVENGYVYIPSTVSYMDQFSAPSHYHGNQIGSIKSTSLPAEWLDWTKEKSSGNPDYTWIESPVTANTFYWQDIQKIFKKENGKFIVPVLYGNDGQPKEFGIVSQVVGLFESYLPLGDMYYANEGGLGDIINQEIYNMMGLISDENGNIQMTTTYQSFWSEQWDVNKPNKWTMLNQTDSSGIQPFESYGPAMEMPMQLSLINAMVEEQYQDIATTTRLFTITAIIVIMWIIIILTKEVVDGTKKEASVLKAIGYGDFKTSSLIVDGNNIMMLLGVALSIPLTIVLISSINIMFMSIFNLPISMVMSFGALAIVGVIVATLITITYLLSYIAFRKVSPLEAINRT